MKKMVKKLRDNVFVLGLVGIGLLVAIIISYTFFNTKDTVESAKSKEMLREETISEFVDPIDAVEYLLSAYIEQDLDKMLRGCAINERASKINTEKIINKMDTFSIAESCPPSGNYSEYLPAARTRLLSEYMDIYDEFIKRFDTLSEVEIKRIDYCFPQLQREEECAWKIHDECETWGANNFVDIIALLSVADQDYMVQFHMINYSGGWKLFSQNCSLVFESDSELKNLCEITEEEYLTYIGTEEEQESFHRRILGDEYEKDPEIIPDKELLPLNYTIYSPEYGKSPEKVIEQFMMSIKKKDMSSVIQLGIRTRLEEDNFEECVEQQKDFLQQLTRFYYHMIYREIGDSFEIKSTGLTGGVLVGWLNPHDLKYMEYESCELVYGEDSSVREYLVYLRYNDEHVITGCTLQNTEEGWQILSLSAQHEGYEIGEVR